MLTAQLPREMAVLGSPGIAVAGSCLVPDAVVVPRRVRSARSREHPRPQDVLLTACSLPTGASAYVEVGTWAAGEVAELAQPFPIRIDLAGLADR